MEDFIRIYDKVYSDEECDKLIRVFEEMDRNKQTWTRKNESKKTEKDDTSFGLRHLLKQKINDVRIPIHGIDFLFDGSLSEKFWACYDNYCDAYGSLRDSIEKHYNLSYKIQKTLPGQGYHIWHFENQSLVNCRRLTSWIIYLNDNFEGGETEFLYLHQRIKPKKGSLLIFPAGFTHTHRGNPPLNGEKYIAAGWTEF